MFKIKKAPIPSEELFDKAREVVQHAPEDYFPGEPTRALMGTALMICLE